MTDETKTRLSGALIGVIALASIAWMELRFRVDRSFSLSMVLVMPVAAAVALNLLIHAPKMPVNRMTMRDGFYAALGAVAGVVNLNRYGAFADGSSVRTPLLIALAVACLCFGLAHLRKQRKD